MVYLSETNRGASIARMLEAIDAPGYAYIRETDPPALKVRNGGWHPIPRETMYAAMESGMEIWYRLGAGRRSARVYVRRPWWKGMTDEEFIPAMGFCIRWWRAEAEKGLQLVSPEQMDLLTCASAIHDLADSDVAFLLRSEAPQVRLAALRLRGAWHRAAGGTAR